MLRTKNSVPGCNMMTSTKSNMADGRHIEIISGLYLRDLLSD